MTESTPSPVDPILALAIQLLGGVAMRPTPDALSRVGWPSTSRQAICDRRRAGTLPCREIRVGDQYFVTAEAVADAFLRSPAANSTVPPQASRELPARRQASQTAQRWQKVPVRRGPGRPRKLAEGAQ